MRFRGAIAWAKFELPKPPVKAPQYRAGVEFTDADAKAIDDFCDRQQDADGQVASARACYAATRAATESSRMIVSSRAEPVDTTAAGTPVSSSSRAM